MDYFLARYYSSAQGRFTSPDEFSGGPDDLFDFADAASANPTFYADLANPQSLNKYQYTFNNPLRYVDPNGHDVLSYELLVSGANHVPKQDNREMLDVTSLGPKEGAIGSHFLYNLRVNFDKGDNLNDYRPVRAAIILGNQEIRNADKENPSQKGQTAGEGQSRFVTDAPGLMMNPGNPKASSSGNALQAIFVAGEYNKKTKSLSSNVAYYAVQVVVGKDGKLDREKTKAFTITRDQFIQYAQQYKVDLPKDKKTKQACPECLLSPPNASKSRP